MSDIIYSTKAINGIYQRTNGDRMERRLSVALSKPRAQRRDSVRSGLRLL